MLWNDISLGKNFGGEFVKISSSTCSDSDVLAFPSGNSTPALTNPTRRGALILLQCFSRASSKLLDIAKPAFRDPAPVVTLFRALTVEKADSLAKLSTGMGLVVRNNLWVVHLESQEKTASDPGPSLESPLLLDTVLHTFP